MYTTFSSQQKDSSLFPDGFANKLCLTLNKTKDKPLVREQVMDCTHTTVVCHYSKIATAVYVSGMTRVLLGCAKNRR